jgi:nucleoside-diphosphate-sugar epimerase
MNIIVTGGNGFLGSNIVKKFIKEKNNLLVFSKNNNNLLDVLDKINYISSNSDELILYKNTIIEFKPDAVIHCGWFGGNKYNDINDIKQFHDNIPSSIKLIELLSELDKKPSFIGFGSFSEYGTIFKQATEDDTENPTNLYGLSKLTFKNYSKLLCNQYNINWTWIRPCFVYGPNDVKTRLIPRLINKFINNENITLDECNSTLDYLYVEDFVRYVYQLTLKKSIGIYNLCSGNEYKLKDVINLIKSLTNSSSEIVFDSSINRGASFNYVCGNNEKIQKTLNIKNSTNLTLGITNIINYEKSSSCKE